MSAVPYARIVAEDIDFGVDQVNVPMPGGGTAVGTQFGQHSIPAEFAQITRSVAQSIAAGTPTTVQLNTEVRDPYDWFNPIAYSLVPDIATPCLLMVTGQLSTGAVTGAITTSIVVNGVAVASSNKYPAGGSSCVELISALVPVTPGQVITLQVTSTGAVTVNTAAMTAAVIGRYT